VDGFVLVVPKDKIQEYKKMAEEGKDMWMKNGALEYMECMGDDLKPQEMGGMKSLSFTELAKAKPNETVWFSFVIYDSKKQRDEVNAKVMAEMDKQAEKYKDIPMPFDMKRMAYGGFEVKVEG
jgi:uncharacterized protein YbaA (DUF1428 family)